MLRRKLMREIPKQISKYPSPKNNFMILSRLHEAMLAHGTDSMSAY